jgi:uncharacterized protein
MLFGAGAFILLDRAERRGAGIEAADIYYRRTLWLILIGLLHAHLIWYGDILYPYAVCGLLLFPFRKLSAKALIITGAVIILLHSLQGLGAGYGIAELRDKAVAAAKAPAPTSEQQKTIQEWKQLAEMFEPAKADVEKEIQAHRSGWVDNLAHRSPLAAMMEFTMFFQFMFLDVLAMLIPERNDARIMPARWRGACVRQKHDRRLEALRREHRVQEQRERAEHGALRHAVEGRRP